MHTPGPWEVVYGIGKSDVMVTDGTFDVCDVSINSTGGNNAEQVANANLIAAAPDLLAACEAVIAIGIVNIFQPPMNSTPWPVIDAQLKAAVKKARGT